jgi:hypothetical protein
VKRATKEMFRMVCLILMLGLTPAPPDESATVLLVTSRELAPAWKPFADWKTRLGKRTKIVTVEDAGGTPQKIRAAVLEHIEKHGTRWVILGGDSEPVPDLDTEHSSGRKVYRDIPTDLYYISEKDWDANGDGIYGRWRDDRKAVAYTHSKGACIGRIPARTAKDVKAYTDKVKAYETAYPEGKFGRTFLYTLPEAMAVPKVVRSWDDYISKAWPKGAAHRFFHNKTPWDKSRPGDYDLTAAHWIKAVNEQVAGKWHVHGHGLIQNWVLEKRSLVTLKHVRGLKNRNAYPVMTTVSCFTGQYDDAKDPCIAEAMLRHPEGGAVAMIAPSREGIPFFHKPSDMRLMITEGKLDGTTRFMTDFWSLGLKDDLTLGEAFAAAKAAMAPDAEKTAGFHFCLCELNLLGDPTLGMRAREVVTPKVEAPAALKPGTQTLKVRTSPGLTVCAWQGDDVYVVVKSSGEGEAVLDIAPHAVMLKLTVSGTSANAVTREIRVQ